jgi:hypothetical protein
MNVVLADVKRKGAAIRRAAKMAMILLVPGVLGGCAGYAPGRQSYWDAQIAEMCKKDGGVTIFEQVQISKFKYQKLARSGGYVGVVSKRLLTEDDVVYAEWAEQILHDSNPRVRRIEQVIKRRDNDRPVARVVSYGRTGGDIPSPAHESSFACPADVEILSAIEKVYAIQGNTK